MVLKEHLNKAFINMSMIKYVQNFFLVVLVELKNLH